MLPKWTIYAQTDAGDFVIEVTANTLKVAFAVVHYHLQHISPDGEMKVLGMKAVLVQ